MYVFVYTWWYTSIIPALRKWAGRGIRSLRTDLGAHLGLQS